MHPPSNKQVRFSFDTASPELADVKAAPASNVSQRRRWFLSDKNYPSSETLVAFKSPPQSLPVQKATKRRKANRGWYSYKQKKVDHAAKVQSTDGAINHLDRDLRIKLMECEKDIVETASTRVPSKKTIRCSTADSPGRTLSTTGPTLSPPDGGTSPPLVLSSPNSTPTPDRRIGGLSTEQRRLKVLRFWCKKHEF